MRSPNPHPARRKALLLLLALLPLLVAASCAPTVRPAVNEAICAIGLGTDPATLTLEPDAWVFDAGTGAGDALNVVAFAGGTGLASTDANAEAVGDGLSFFASIDLDVTEGNSIRVNLTGADRSITVSYNRETTVEPKFCRIRE